MNGFVYGFWNDGPTFYLFHPENWADSTTQRVFFLNLASGAPRDVATQHFFSVLKWVSWVEVGI